MRKTLFIITIAALFTALCSARNARAAVGDTVASCTSVAASGTLDVQPGAGVEWVLHSIWFTLNVELQRYDGTNTAAVTQLIGPDYHTFSPAIHVTNGNRIRLVNLNGGSANIICYDGVVTK